MQGKVILFIQDPLGDSPEETERPMESVIDKQLSMLDSKKNFISWSDSGDDWEEFLERVSPTHHHISPSAKFSESMRTTTLW